MIRLVQLSHGKHGRRVAVAAGDELMLLRADRSIFDLASRSAKVGDRLEAVARKQLGPTSLDYATVYEGSSDWRILAAFDHPGEPARCLVTGTGLTHNASARNRQAMHEGSNLNQAPTDSMRMYQWGLEGGRPKGSRIGVAPEWFFKGTGTILRAHGEPLDVPEFAEDGGEEAEVAGAYLIDSAGRPRRVGLMLANEFSDHKLESRNYLYLAPSKLRTCAVGPELVVGAGFQDAHGTTRILRRGKVFWSKPFATGERNMSHTLANLEHHHFKYAAHRRPGDAHIHFFGADTFSFGDGIGLVAGDVMEIELAGFGKPLRNPIRILKGRQKPVRVTQL